MNSQVKVLIVRGGAVGCGIAQYRARAGWDKLLVERDELTAGLPCHAARRLPLFNMG